MVKWQKVVEGECEKLSQVPEGAYPTEIEGLVVEGFCEGCGIPFVEGDKYYEEEGGYFCADCTEFKILDPEDTSMDE